MKRFERAFGWVLAGALCCALIAVPVSATETEKGETAKDETKPAKESDLVKASREIKAKKTGTAKTYSNDDLQQREPAAKVYTNDDLTRMYGDSEEAETTTAAPEGSSTGETAPELPDPLTQMEQEKTAQASREAEIAAAESALAAAQAKLQNLEKQLLATRNPFSARPALSEEEQEYRETSGETAAERNERTQKLVDEAKQEVADAEAALARARGQ